MTRATGRFSIPAVPAALLKLLAAEPRAGGSAYLKAGAGDPGRGNDRRPGKQTGSGEGGESATWPEVAVCRQLRS